MNHKADAGTKFPESFVLEMEAVVQGYRDLIDSLDLPDSNDRHVLAAAIRARADVILTFNMEDFPADRLAEYGIEAQHPDEFIEHLIDLNQAKVCAGSTPDAHGVRPVPHPPA